MKSPRTSLHYRQASAIAIIPGSHGPHRNVCSNVQSWLSAACAVRLKKLPPLFVPAMPCAAFAPAARRRDLGAAGRLRQAAPPRRPATAHAPATRLPREPAPAPRRYRGRTPECTPVTAERHLPTARSVATCTHDLGPRAPPSASPPGGLEPWPKAQGGKWPAADKRAPEPCARCPSAKLGKRQVGQGRLGSRPGT